MTSVIKIGHNKKDGGMSILKKEFGSQGRQIKHVDWILYIVLIFEIDK